MLPFIHRIQQSGELDVMTKAYLVFSTKAGIASGKTSRKVADSIQKLYRNSLFSKMEGNCCQIKKLKIYASIIS